jgi:hypothetical protein
MKIVNIMKKKTHLFNHGTSLCHHQHDATYYYFHKRNDMLAERKKKHLFVFNIKTTPFWCTC